MWLPGRLITADGVHSLGAGFLWRALPETVWSHFVLDRGKFLGIWHGFREIPPFSALLGLNRYGIKRAPQRQLIHTYIDTLRRVPRLKRGCAMGCTEA